MPALCHCHSFSRVPQASDLCAQHITAYQEDYHRRKVAGLTVMTAADWFEAIQVPKGIAGRETPLPVQDPLSWQEHLPHDARPDAVYLFIVDGMPKFTFTDSDVASQTLQGLEHMGHVVLVLPVLSDPDQDRMASFGVDLEVAV